MEQEASYYAIINARVRYDDRLTANAKLLYGEITALANKNGYCYATNSYFAELYKVTERTIIRLIKQLDELGYISVRLTGNPTSGIAYGRRIYIDSSAAAIFDQETLTKMSPPDKNVTQTLTKMSPHTLNNKNNIYIRAREKKTDDSEARSELTAWAESYTDDSYELVSRLLDFCDSRKRKQNPIPSGRAVTILTNKLIRYSNGSIPVMLRMLDEAIERNWSSVYELKPDIMREVLDGTSDDEEAGDKWL